MRGGERPIPPPVPKKGHRVIPVQGPKYDYWGDPWTWRKQGYDESWYEQCKEWIKNPKPYGGLSVLRKIKEEKERGATELSLKDLRVISDLTPLAGLTNLTELVLDDNNISDITPLAGLTNLEVLQLGENKISDLTPLAGLTYLEVLELWENNITVSQKAMLEEALPATDIGWD